MQADRAPSTRRTSARDAYPSRVALRVRVENRHAAHTIQPVIAHTASNNGQNSAGPARLRAMGAAKAAAGSERWLGGALLR